MNDEIIVCSCFSQQKPDTVIFPEEMTGVTFINCNLDNVLIPPGNTVEGGLHRRYLTLEDGTDWIIDENNNPVEPL